MRAERLLFFEESSVVVDWEKHVLILFLIIILVGFGAVVPRVGFLILAGSSDLLWSKVNLSRVNLDTILRNITGGKYCLKGESVFWSIFWSMNLIFVTP